MVQGSPQAEVWNRKAMALRRKFADDWPRKPIVEAAHYLSMNMDLVEEFFPEAKILHLYRPGAEVANSFINKTSQQIYANGQHRRSMTRWTWWGDCFPLWEGCTSQVEGYARYWQACHEAISKTSLPRLIVRMEDLSSVEGWGRILDFLGLEGHVVEPGRRWNARDGSRKQGPGSGVIDLCKKWCTWRPDQG
jgi:hypothetical protein